MDNLEVIRELGRRWNAGDMEAVLELYAEDAVTRTGSHWPEQASYEGRDAIRASIEDWLSMWDMSLADIDSVQEYGDKVLATGCWRMRGRSSGVDGEMPIVILFTLRDGKIAVLEWFPSRDEAVAAARGA